MNINIQLLGGEGVGKSTIAAALAKRLGAHGSTHDSRADATHHHAWLHGAHILISDSGNKLPTYTPLPIYVGHPTIHILERSRFPPVTHPLAADFYNRIEILAAEIESLVKWGR